MNNQVRKLTEGAMMCALFGLVLIINRQFAQALEIFFVFILPLPMVVYTVKYGFKSALVCAVSICLLSLMISPFTSMFYSIMSVIIGLIYGTLVTKKAPSGVLISVTMILTLVLEVLCMIVMAGLFGYDLVADALMIEQAYLTASEMLEAYGVAFQMPDSSFFVMIAVVSVLLTGLMEGFLVHLFSGLLLKRLKIDTKLFSPLSMWNVPKWVGYAGALCYLGMYFSQTLAISQTAQLCIMAIGIIGTLVLVLFGYVACLMFAMVKYKKNITLWLILLFVFIWQFMAVFGFFYITSDEFKQMILRRRDENEQKN